MNILVIYTGGTIGSKAQDGTISLESGSDIIERFRKIDSDYNFKEDFFINILSENADDCFYEKLINHILSLDLSGYDGLIITHGTDTLSYTSTLMSMALRHLSIPVAFVSGNLVPSNENSNALDNLKMALGYFTCGGKGFIVPYRNKGGRQLIHLATRIHEADFANDDFNSAGFVPFAEIVNNYFVTYEEKTEVTKDSLCVPKKRIIKDSISLKNKILLIKAFPSIDYSCFDISKVKAVLHTAYHSGTASSKALPEFINRCKENGVGFYICPVKRNENQYETTKEILSLGAVPMYNMTLESALSKLKLKYNLPHINLNENLYYEEYGIKY